MRDIRYDKLPMFIGQIIMKNYVPGPAVSFAAIGDANSDGAPLQVGQFEADNRLDDVLSKVWIEEGGGGTGQESYELAAYFYARHSVLDCLKQGRKGYFFFLGDEGFYPQVRREQVRRILGREESADLDAKTIFAELAQKYHVFFIYPQKSMAERRSDIDAEIKKRVEAAGGIYEGVDVRASLIWDNRNDLDLHMITPSGEHIFYGHKQSHCRGELDVDRNVRGETTKPVENIRWRKGTAPAGSYRLYVQNDRLRQSSVAGNAAWGSCGPSVVPLEQRVCNRVRTESIGIGSERGLLGKDTEVLEQLLFVRRHNPIDAIFADQAMKLEQSDLGLDQGSDAIKAGHHARADLGKGFFKLGCVATGGKTYIR